MRRFITRKLYIAIDFMLPCALAVVLVSQYGLVWIFAVFVIELLQVLLSRYTMPKPWKTYDLWKNAITSIGIVVASLMYPVRSTPRELSIAAIILIVVIHFAVLMILSNPLRK